MAQNSSNKPVAKIKSKSKQKKLKQRHWTEQDIRLYNLQQREKSRPSWISSDHTGLSDSDPYGNDWR